MSVEVVIRKNSYFDSVTLMLISKEIKSMDGVTEVLVGMATELNKELAENLNLSTNELQELSPNDFFIAALLTEQIQMDEVVEKVDELLSAKKSSGDDTYQPATLATALKMAPDTNLALVSVPGQYAEDVVKEALDKDLHVMLFSDNVSLEAEISLKKKAVEKGLLMMGPDCGTAIINGVPLAFANAVKRGKIGLVGASGTGTQEVTVLVDRLGEGISQAIGTGGRDLSGPVGGLMMLEGFKALIADEDTRVIVLVSKPPAPEVAKKILELAKETDKPVIVNFIGGDPEVIKAAGAIPCLSLEDTAWKAVQALRGKEITDFEGFTMDEKVIKDLAAQEASKMSKDQKFVRGLFTGGTLADEAMKIMGKKLPGIYSNIPLDPAYQLGEDTISKEHTVIDLGDDMFTRGRPHPMIDPSTRTERIPQEIERSVALLLVDIVLGYGSHEDPAGEVAKAVKDAKEKAEKDGNYLSVVASICGTDADPQSFEASKETLEEAGVIVMPSNAQAVRMTLEILDKIGG